MPSDPRGIYRSRTEESGAQHAHVDYGKAGVLPIPEATYRVNGYSPPFEELPWEDEYKETKAKSDKNA